MKGWFGEQQRMVARLLCYVLAMIKLGQSLSVHTVLVSLNGTEIATAYDLQQRLLSTGITLDINTVTITATTMFPSVAQVYTEWPHAQLVLIPPTLCDKPSTSVWLNGLSFPYICLTEDDGVSSLVESYARQCIPASPSLKTCLDDIVSLPSPEDVLAALVERSEWTLAAIFYDSLMESTAGLVSSELSQTGVQTVMYRIYANESDEHIYNTINHAISLLAVPQRNFILLCGGACGLRILGQANKFSDRATAMKMMSSWLVVVQTEDWHTYNNNMHLTLDNVATVFMSSTMLQYNPITRNGTCLDSSGVVMQGGSGKCLDVVVNTLLYKPGTRHWETVATFNTQGQLLIEHSLFPNRNFGFNKRKLLVATILWAPFSIKRMEGNTSIYEGICMDLLQELARTFNFTYEVTEPEDGEFGRIVNGSWTGVVGLLERQQVDMAVAPLTVTQERETVMDFVYPYYYDAGAALYKLPDKMSSKWLTLLKPFKWEVFFCIGVVFLSTSFMLTTMEYVTIHKLGGREKIADILSSCTWHILGTYFKHGSRKRLRSRPGRILISFLWLFCIIVVAAYSGNLIAFLTVTKNSPPFKTLAEVAEQTEYTWGTDGGSMWTTLFKTSNRSDYRRIWEGIVKHNKSNPEVLSLSPGLHRGMVEEGSYLMFFDRDVIAVWAQDNCDLVLLEETFYQITYAVALPQHSPYNRMLSQKMLSIEQSGLLQIWKGNWWPKSSECAGQLQVQAKIIELVDLQSAFYALAIGCGLSLCVLIIERIRKCIC